MDSQAQQLLHVEDATEQRTSYVRENRINFSGEFVKVNRNQISFAFLSNQIKHIFVYSLKQCSDRGCMKQVFHRWGDQPVIHLPKKLILNDQEGIQLIWRMQKAIQKNKIQQNVVDLQKQLYTIKNQHQSYQKSYKEMEKKENQLRSLQIGENSILMKESTLNKIINFQSWVSEKMIYLHNKIANIQIQLNKAKKRESLNSGNSAIMNKILSKAISKQVRNLLRDTIIGIIQTTHKVIVEGQMDNEQVYIIFQQAYKTKKIKKSTIVKYIGSQAYLQKVNRTHGLLDHRKSLNQVQAKLNNFMCCHRCMKICNNKNLKYCHTQIGERQTMSYTCTDYQSYRKSFLEGDYFYEAQEQHVLPFFIYNINNKGKPICNRAFCQECVNLLFPDKPFVCAYCAGLCACARCQKAIGLVKLIALDYHNDPEYKKRYHLLLKLFGGTPHSEVSQIFELRLPSHNFELSYLDKTRGETQSRQKLFLQFNFEIQNSMKKQRKQNCYYKQQIKEYSQPQILQQQKYSLQKDNINIYNDISQNQMIDEQHSNEMLQNSYDRFNIFNDDYFEDKEWKKLKKSSREE